MALDPALAALLTDTVYLASKTALSGSGQPSWGSPTSVSARVEAHTRLIDRPDGTQLTVTHTIYLNTSRTPVLGDRIWLPGTNSAVASDAVPVLHVKPLPGITSGSTSHFEIAVSRNAQ